jgi:ATP-dependent helicase/nuclease subunit A
MINNTADISPARMGSVYHAVFENLDFGYTKLEEIEALVNDMTDRGIITKLEAERLDRNKFLRFLSSELGRRLKNCKRSYREKPFVMNLPAYEIYGDSYADKPEANVIVHGIIDLFFYEGDNIILVDYKTDRIKKDVNELREKYAVQLSMYKRAIEMNTGKKVTQTIYYSVYNDEALVIE